MSNTVAPWSAACQASLFFTVSLSLLKFMAIESVMPSNHLIFCHLLLLLPLIFPSIPWKTEWSVSHSVVSDSLQAHDCSPPGSSVRGILQTRVLEWVVIVSSRVSSWTRDWTWVSWISGRFFTIWATREAWFLDAVFSMCLQQVGVRWSKLSCDSYKVLMPFMMVLPLWRNHIPMPHLPNIITLWARILTWICGGQKHSGHNTSEPEKWLFSRLQKEFLELKS